LENDWGGVSTLGYIAKIYKITVFSRTKYTNNIYKQYHKIELKKNITQTEKKQPDETNDIKKHNERY
jgi:hypothetical protein